MKGQSKRRSFRLRTKKGLETMIQNKNAPRGRAAFWKYSALYLAVLLTSLAVTAGMSLPSQKTYFEGKEVSSVLNISDTEKGTYTVTAKLFGAIPVKTVTVEVIPEKKLVPCGDVFGVKFFTKGVIVIGDTDIETENGFINPARQAGIRKNDVITKANGAEINTVEELAATVESSKGKPLYIEYTRDGQSYACEVKPALSLTDRRYKTGIWVRDSTAGIGTMTYYNPENGSFAGLGHGICDIDTGELMPLLRATVVDVGITDIVKGRSGAPGELKGVFDTEKRGTLIGNTAFGVYGMLDDPPKSGRGALSVAGRDEVHDGEASILVNPDGDGVKEYAVRLSKVDHRSDGTKSFVVEITDPALISLTGGIVQGMSGSPVLQDGKLAGAVTHVLVGEPTKGYGIFLENMLAKMPELTK